MGRAQAGGGTGAGPGFLSVQYYDPFSPLPPGQTQAGVQAFLTNPPANTIAYGRLLANSVPTWSNSGTATQVTVLNDVPLAPDLSYQLQVAFAPQGGSPNWSGPGVLKAPVVCESVQLTSLTVGASGNPNTPVRITWAWERIGGSSVSAAFLQLVLVGASSSDLVDFSLSTGSPTILDTTLGPGDYQVVLSAALPTAGTGGGAPGGPYTLGPSTLPQWIPTKAPTITAVTCATGIIAVQWTAPVTAAATAAPGWDLLLLDGTNVVASAAAGPSGGQISMAGVEALTTPQVAGRMRFGPLAGPVGAAAPLYQLAPTIAVVQVIPNGPNAKIKVQLSSPGALPAGGTLLATLYTNGFAAPPQAVSGDSTTTFVLSPVAAGTAYAVDAMVQVTAAGQTSRGPRSPRIAVPVATPEVTAAGYDGRTVTIELEFDTPVAVDGYDVSLFGPAQLDFKVGSALPIVFPASLDLASGYKMSVTPFVGVVRAASSPSSTRVNMAAIAPPAVTAVDYDGALLTVRWSAATLPFLSGYRVSVAGRPNVIAGESETSCAIPLTPAEANGASVTVTGLSPLRETAASTAVAIVSSLTPIASLAVDPAGSAAKAGWTPAASVTGYRLRLTQDGAATELAVDGAATSYSFAPSPGAAAALSLAAVVVSGGARATGPFGPPAPVPHVAPVLLSTAYDGAQLSLAWSPVAGATNYRATVFRQGAAAPELQPPPFPPGSNQAGFAFAPSVPDGSYSVVLQALFGAFDGPASAAAPVLAAAATLAPPKFDGRTITAAVTAPAGPRPVTYAVKLLRDGAEIQSLTQMLAGGMIELAVAKPADPAAAFALAIRPMLGPALGPGASAAAALTAPPVAAIAWNTTIDVTAALAAGWTGAARLLVDGAAQEPVAFDAEGKASLPVPATGAMALSARGALVGATGPWSAPIALSRAVPDGVTARLDGNSLNISWRPVAGADAYRVTLDLVGATGSSETVGGTDCVFTLPAGVTAATVSVAAVAGIVTSPASAAVAAILDRVQLATLDYQQGVLALGWTPVGGAAGYRLGVLVGTTVVAEAVFDGAAGSIPIEPGPYGVVLRACSAAALGPAEAAPAMPLTTAPAVIGAAFDPASGDCTLIWTAVAGATLYAIRLTAVGQPPLDEKIPSNGPPVSYTVPAAKLDGNGPWIFTCQAQTAGPPAMTGPWSTAFVLPDAVPAGVNVQFEGSQLAVAWNGIDNADGYAVTVVTDKGRTTVRAFEPQTMLALPKGATTANVSVAAILGLATGRSSPPVTVLFAVPALTSVAYDGASLSLGWNPVDGASTYRVVARAGSTVLEQAEFAGTEGVLPLAPGSYAIELRALAGGAASPASAPVTPITGAPAIALAAFDPASGDCTIAWPPMAGTTGYGIRLTAPGRDPITDTASAAGYTIPAAKMAGVEHWSFACRALAAGTVSGPWSQAVALPDAVPSGIALQLDGSQLAASWDAVDNADGYQVTLVTDKGNKPVRVFEPRALLALPKGATTASVSVAAILGLTTGRSSPPLAALFDVPVLTGAAYDGATLSLGWQAVDGASGYRAAAMAGSSVLAQAEFAATQGAMPLAPGAWNIVLRALAGGAASPLSLPLSPITEEPVVASVAFDPTSGDCTITWPEVPGAGGYDIVLTAPGQPPFDDTTGATDYKISAAQLAGAERWNFACQPVAEGAVVGPWSRPTALPDAVPAGITLQLDGTELAVAWDAVDNADGYAVTLVTDKGTTTVSAFEPRALLTLPAGATSANVSVAAILGLATGRASPPVAALFAPPALTSAAYDGATLSLGWNPVAGASGFRVALLAGNSVIGQAEFGAAPGAIPIAPGGYTIVLRTLAAGAASPASPPLAPIMAAPVIASAAFDAKSGDCTLGWAPVPGAAGYAIRLTTPGQAPFTGTATVPSCTIPAARLAGGGPFAFQVQADAEGPPHLSGPWSEAVALPSLPPSLSETSFDGSTIRAAWAPVGGAEGYRLSLLSAGSATALGDVGGPSAEIAPVSAPAADAALLVQAIGPLGPGPASAPSPLLSRGWFVAAATPHGLAPLAGPAAQPADLILSLPDLFGGTTPTLPPATATFKFQAAAPGYSLTVLGTGPAWKWDDTSRAAVRSDYASLTTALEQAHWTPQARALLLEAIARALPQRFDETGYFAYGFEPGQGWFDLRPGMVLHVEYEAYQYLGPIVDPNQASFLDGFIAATAADYPITGAWDGQKWFVTLDSTLAAMAAGEQPGIHVPTIQTQGDFSAGGGGLIDAFFDQFRQPLCRIVYPPTLLDPSSSGDARLAGNPVLLAAATLADLSLAAQAVRQQAPLPASVGAFYFRGRATLSPRIRVSLDGQPLLVAVGATVGDVLAEHGARGAGPTPGLRVRRGTGPAAILPDRPASLDVRLDWTAGSDPAWLDLPLMPGDRVETAR